MSDTPHYVSALDVEEWATKCINLERERDELQDALEHAQMTISSIVSPSDKATLELIKVTKERDEAREEINIIRNTLSKNGEAVGNGEHYFSIIEMVENLMQSKDYFIRKSDSLERERDEAREDLEFLRGLYKVLDEANSHLMTVNEEAVKLARTLKQERDEAREDLSAMVDVRFYRNAWEKLNEIAK